MIGKKKSQMDLNPAIRMPVREKSLVGVRTDCEVVINGVRGVSSCALIPCLTLVILLDGKEAKVTAMESK